jgi:diphthamide synthase (EF-2-diphthine--ammonia ligase)
MAETKKAVFNWSGGKDSSLALYHVLEGGEYSIAHLLTTVNQFHNRVSMHGVRTALMEQQAESIGLPLFPVRLTEMPEMEEYNQKMADAWAAFKAEGVTHSIFGDIFLEDLKTYREEQLAKVGLQGVFPIWKRR